MASNNDSPSSSRSNPAIWLKGKKKDEQDAILFALKNNTTLIETLKEILYSFEQEEIRAERNLAQYDSPAWAYLQADRNGAMRTLAKVRALFPENEDS